MTKLTKRISTFNISLSPSLQARIDNKLNTKLEDTLLTELFSSYDKRNSKTKARDLTQLTHGQFRLLFWFSLLPFCFCAVLQVSASRGGDDIVCPLSTFHWTQTRHKQDCDSSYTVTRLTYAADTFGKHLAKKLTAFKTSSSGEVTVVGMPTTCYQAESG